MIRRSENSIAVRAGMLSVLVHLLLLGILIFSVSWKWVPPMSIAEVELWDKLPSQPPVHKPQPVPKPEVVKPEPKPDPVEEPKADIQIKKEKIEPPKPKEKPPEKVEKPQPPKPDLVKKEVDKKKQEDLLKKLQQDMLAEDSKPQQEAHKQAGVTSSTASVANAGEIDKAKAAIINKIKRNVNNQLCGSGKPELEIAISLMPTGEVSGTPRLLKSSGIPSCDEAVERAILVSQPLPLPDKAELFSQFRDLKLKFRPNDGN